MAERFLYIPSVGFSVAIALVFVRISRAPIIARFISKRAIYCVVGCLIAMLSARTIARNFDWKNESVFFGALAKQKPTLVGARVSYGKALINEKKYLEALSEFETVARLQPGSPEIWAAQLNFLRAMTSNKSDLPGANGSYQVRQ
jgi:hypothetical protein